ncbi:histidine kinase [Sphingobacteriaceae bacterium]|nr:histidine kinase [Sphingobacteriaceae bacterium]
MVSERPIRSRFFISFLHISAWTIIFILPLLFDKNGPRPPDNFKPVVDRAHNFQIVSTLMNLSFIPLFYFNALFLVPRFFNRKNWMIYVTIVIGCTLLIAGINELVKNFMGLHHPFPPFNRVFILLSVCILITSTAYSVIQKNIKNEELRKEKESENLKTELSFLRSQVSPHFLFNTLNNLVSLARKKSDLLEPSLLKLSGLLQYMLYETDHEKISIHKEIEYLENYIELQKLRFGSEVTVSFYKEITFSSSVEVVPMILIPFVENAFKHGVVYINDPEISISIVVIGNLLTLSVNNKYKVEREEKDKSTGIGLANVKRRLFLLYPKCTLNITAQNNFHSVKLSITL